MSGRLLFCFRSFLIMEKRMTPTDKVQYFSHRGTSNKCWSESTGEPGNVHVCHMLGYSDLLSLMSLWSATHYWSRTYVMACVYTICQSFFYGSRRSGGAPRTSLGFLPAWLAPSSSLCSVLSWRPWRGGLLWWIYPQSSPAWHWTGWPNVAEGEVLCFPCCCRTRPGSRTEPSVPISSCVRSSASTSLDQSWQQQRWRMDLRRRKRKKTCFNVNLLFKGLGSRAYPSTRFMPKLTLTGRIKKL